MNKVAYSCLHSFILLFIHSFVKSNQIRQWKWNQKNIFKGSEEKVIYLYRFFFQFMHSLLVLNNISSHPIHLISEALFIGVSTNKSLLLKLLLHVVLEVWPLYNMILMSAWQTELSYSNEKHTAWLTLAVNPAVDFTDWPFQIVLFYKDHTGCVACLCLNQSQSVSVLVYSHMIITCWDCWRQ